MMRYRLTVLLLALLLTACQTSYRPNSPERRYSDQAEANMALKVPPDLTDISQGEQFVLPGTRGGELSRNTLLPSFANVSLQRGDGERWLRIEATPEALWPELVRFMQREGYRIDQTRPLSGVIVTQWRENPGNSGGLLPGRGARDAAYSRMTFRIERDGEATRLFAREQVAEDADSVERLVAWPANSHDAEATSAMLTRLLVFLGLEEQRARGLLSPAEEAALLDSAHLERNASGSSLLIHSAFDPAFDAVRASLEGLDYRLGGVDRSAGRYEALQGETGYLFTLEPLHLSAARLRVFDTEGAALDTERQQAILEAIRQRLV